MVLAKVKASGKANVGACVGVFFGENFGWSLEWVPGENFRAYWVTLEGYVWVFFG